MYEEKTYIQEIKHLLRVVKIKKLDKNSTCKYILYQYILYWKFQKCDYFLFD